jgi:hypothetical protein
LGSYEIGTPANIVGPGSGMNLIATYTLLPIGVYILNANVYITSFPFSSNIQFGLNATIQNPNLQNLLSTTGTVATVVRLTSLWVQTSAVDVYFSCSGQYNFHNIAISYLRIA